ncbi:MAG: hypothetical protein JSV20_05430 [Candidatus Bathyarchaeota archaeon]|nr:MAG: hypothetical protein JSV20_05430 [Candidatus Bathyarchaeota archaeon]
MRLEKVSNFFFTRAKILWETISPYTVFLVALPFETSAILLAIPIPETLKKTRALEDTYGEKDRTTARALN